MRILFDADLCESNGICVAAAPDLFDLDDDDYLVISDETPPESKRAAVEKAVRGCPKNALKIED